MLDNFNIIFYLFMYLKSVIKGVTKGWMIRESSCFPFELVRKRKKKNTVTVKKRSNQVVACGKVLMYMRRIFKKKRRIKSMRASVPESIYIYKFRIRNLVIGSET